MCSWFYFLNSSDCVCDSQLKQHMASVMEDVCLMWIRSQFYCKPSRMVVLLQEICNLLIHLVHTFVVVTGRAQDSQTSRNLSSQV